MLLIHHSWSLLIRHHLRTHLGTHLIRTWIHLRTHLITLLIKATGLSSLTQTTLTLLGLLTLLGIATWHHVCQRKRLHVVIFLAPIARCQGQRLRDLQEDCLRDLRSGPSDGASILKNLLNGRRSGTRLALRLL